MPNAGAALLRILWGPWIRIFAVFAEYGKGSTGEIRRVRLVREWITKQKFRSAIKNKKNERE
jgi:hypothetical protein